MANDVNKVVNGKPLATGGVLRNPATTGTLPTDATTAPDVAFIALGYIGPDGLTETVDRQTNKIKAWGGDVVKVVQTDFSVTYQFTFYESINADVLKAVYGDPNVTVTPANATHGAQTSTAINSAPLPKAQWIFEVKDGGARIRVVVPLGQITAVGEVTYSDETTIGYQVTVEAFPDSAGNQAYKYTDDGVLSA